MRTFAETAKTSQPTASAQKNLQRKAAGRSERAPAIVHRVLQTSGQPLDAATRSFMEPRFRHDFSRIRVHQDSQAATSAREVGALAYTVGNDVVFAQGQFAPHTMGGRRLLAHELAHTVQQSSVAQAAHHAPAEGLRVADKNDPLEQEAESVSTSVLSGQGEASFGKHAMNVSQHPMLWRQPAPDTHAPEKKGQADETEKGGGKTPAPVATECKPPSNVALPCTPKGLADADFMKIGAPGSALGFTRLAGTGPPPPEVHTRQVGKSTRVVMLKTKAEPIPCESSFTKAGTVARLIKLDASVPKQEKFIEQCGKTYVGYFRITPEGEQKISEAEMEHCKDFKRAFDVSLGCYAGVVNDIANTGTTFDSEAAAVAAVTKRVGLEPGKWMARYLELLHKTEVRDDQKWHTAVQPKGPFFLDNNKGHCSSQQPTEVNADSFPEVGKDKKSKREKHPSADVVK